MNDKKPNLTFFGRIKEVFKHSYRSNLYIPLVLQLFVMVEEKSKEKKENLFEYNCKIIIEKEIIKSDLKKAEEGISQLAVEELELLKA